MEKEEILHRSRMEQKDEREEIIKDKSMKWMVITMFCVAAVFAFIRSSKGESMYDLTVTVCSAVTVSNLYRYVHMKEKEYLYIGAITLAATIMSLFAFCMGR